MEEQSFLDRMISNLRASCKCTEARTLEEIAAILERRVSVTTNCVIFNQIVPSSDRRIFISYAAVIIDRYYTGYPKDLGPSRVIPFTSEREFMQLLHEGYPVVVAFTIRCNLTKRLDKVIEEAAAECYPHVKFMRVECPKYPGFCLTRQRKEYPFIEVFHTPEQAANQGKVVDPNVTKYSVKVLPFNYDLSAYGFREFFKRHGIQSSEPK